MEKINNSLGVKHDIMCEIDPMLTAPGRSRHYSGTQWLHGVGCSYKHNMFIPDMIRDETGDIFDSEAIPVHYVA